MKNEKYINFDGMASQVPNDMPWGPTHWSNMQGTNWQQSGQALNTGTDWQDASMNATGKSRSFWFFDTDTNKADTDPTDDVGVGRRSRGEYNPDVPIVNMSGAETITLDHHHNMSPNMELVLPDNDNSVMPDSDQWSNHPGFLGGTWWKDFWFPGKAEKERAAAARESIDSKFPISGSCTLLNSTVDKINNDIAYHNKATKRGPKRVAKRNIPLLKKKLSTVTTNRDIQCQAEEDERLARQQENVVMQQQWAQQMAPPKSSISPVNMILGLVVIGGLVWGISRLARPKSAPAK